MYNIKIKLYQFPNLQNRLYIYIYIYFENIMTKYETCIG